MHPLFAVVLVLVGITGVSIGFWAATTKPPLFRIRNACLFGACSVVAMVILLLVAMLIRDNIFTTTMIVLFGYGLFWVGRSLNLT